ncbi:MAG: acyltransferase [Saprospiraceae bacterium]|nr:acyltransferase [Saprospiraceae bacterium]
MYIKGINSFRFFAAMLVLVFHCNDGLRQVSNDLFYAYPILTKGPFAVDLFFIISGFLLTYLALNEIKTHKKFDLKNFFVRRVLRIFPLYYLIVLISFVSIGMIYPRISGQHYFDFSMSEAIWYYIAFIPNVAIVKWNNIGPMYSLWSIGVEEQFYLFFPYLIIFMTRIKRELYIASFCFLFYTLFYLGIYHHLIDVAPWFYQLVVLTLRFHFLFFGVLLAVLFVNYRDNLFFRFIGKPWVQILIFFAFAGAFIFLPVRQDPHNFIGTLFFGLILINLGRNVSLVDFEWQTFTYLGIISYGIYVFHPLVSAATRLGMDTIPVFRQLIFKQVWIYYLLVSLVTFGVASLSYRYFESYFLKLKKRSK